MTVSVFHVPPTDTKPYVLVPVGYFHNQKCYKLKKGDRVKFIAEDNGYRWYFVRLLEVDIESAAFSFWCQTLYSCDDKYPITKEMIFKRWDMQVTRLGFNPSSISKVKCLVIEVRKEKKES